MQYDLYLIKNGRVFSNKVSDTAYFSDDNIIKEPSYQYRLNKKDQVVNNINDKILKIKMTDIRQFR